MIRAWALVTESNGGQAVLGARVVAPSPHLAVVPTQLDLGTVGIARPGDQKIANLTGRNTGHGALTARLTTGVDWQSIEPTGFRCSDGEEGTSTPYPPDTTQCLVHFSDSWIGRCPVTNEQCAVLVKATRRRQPKFSEGSRPPPGKDDHAMEFMIWWDALALCR